MRLKNQALVQVRIDRKLKDAVLDVYEAIGMDMPTAIRMFFKRSVAVGGLPFEGRIVSNAGSFRRVDGMWTNSPLDEIVSTKHRRGGLKLKAKRRTLLAAMDAAIEENSRTLDHDWKIEEIDAEIAAARSERRMRRSSTNI